ncbi:MAG: hypothetical protein NTW28_18675, partial [Candidatus Solibacter sp.]|nr:hypothetical protein [Candidatus Solibacter sp.]
MKKKSELAALEAADLDGLIAEITVDANGKDEQLRAFRQAFEDEVAVPCAATVMGEPVQALKFDYDGNARRGLMATCRRVDGTERVVAACDVLIPLSVPGGRQLAAYRHWMGLEPVPAATRGGVRRQSAAAALDLGRPCELVVLSVKPKAARCRVLGSDRIFTFRTDGLWRLVPGEIAAVLPGKQWTYAGNP